MKVATLYLKNKLRVIRGGINIIITIQAKKGEGIAFTTSKIATMFSNSRNVIIIADRDDISDKACIVPYAPVIEVEDYEWERFQDDMPKYIQKIEQLMKGNNGMEEQLFLYLIIDGRYIDEEVLVDFIDNCSRKLHNKIIPIVMKYL